MERSYFKRGDVGYFLQHKKRDGNISVKIYSIDDFKCVKEMSEHELVVGAGKVSRGNGLLGFHFFDVPELDKNVDRQSLEKYFAKKKHLRYEAHEFEGSENDR